MDSKGYSTVETAITFPLFLMLIVVLMFVMVTFILPKDREEERKTVFIERIHNVDSLKRKAEIVEGIFK
jgi:hypothetical protein